MGYSTISALYLGWGLEKKNKRQLDTLGLLPPAAFLLFGL